MTRRLRKTLCRGASDDRAGYACEEAEGVRVSGRSGGVLAWGRVLDEGRVVEYVVARVRWAVTTRGWLILNLDKKEYVCLLIQTLRIRYMYLLDMYIYSFNERIAL